MRDDRTLLREYATSRSESAFAELVERHLALVYSTALRSMNGDADLAKDVCQSVFLDLARKAASLANRSVLAGWLYTSTCFAAAKTVRSERRRQAREQEAHRMHDQLSSSSQDSAWEQLRPVLDALMLELKQSDREALLLRYFERRSLADVGEKLGLSENAARMRVDRALERLRDLLARRGLASPSAALTLVLSHQAVGAVPAGLAASITATSLTSAAVSGSSILSLIAMTKAKSIVLGVLVAAGAVTPIVYQYQMNARLRADLEVLRSRLAGQVQPPPPSDSADADRLRREHEELMRLRGEVTLLRRQAAATSNSTADVREFDRLKAAKLAKFADEAASTQVALAKHPEIPMLPSATWTNVGFANPASALQTLNWASAHKDTNAFLNAVSWDPQVRARADALFAVLPESVQAQFGSVDGVVIDWMLSHATPMAGFRVLSQTEQGPDDITVLEQHQYTDERVRENSVPFHRDENGDWRMVLPQEMMPKLEHVIGNLAGTPVAGNTSGGK